MSDLVPYKDLDRLHAERYRALRDFRKEYMPYLYVNHPMGFKYLKVPRTDEECDEAVDQMIAQWHSYREKE